MTPRSQARTALAEWMAVAVLLLGCAVATAGVMTLVADTALAFGFILAGAVVAVVGAVAWTVIVKRRDPNPRAVKREL